MSDLLTILAALGYGALSALVPVFNAELYMGVVAAAADVSTAWMATVALSVGTMVGKLVIFEASKRGSSMFDKRSETLPRREPRTRLGRWVRSGSDLMVLWLKDPRLGPITVLVSSVVGIPPLFVVAVLAGASGQNRILFCLAVLVGRFLRFGIITWPLTVAALPW